MEPATREDDRRHDSRAGGWYGEEDPPWIALRHRYSRDFIVRVEQERDRARSAEAAIDGEQWDDDAVDAHRAYSDPASKKAMLDMPVPEVGETREQDCAVCLEDFVAGAGAKALRMMPCSHSFHQSCIWDWLLVNRLCPVCRFAMPPKSADDELVMVEKEATSEQAGGNGTEECPSTEPHSQSL
ncbi:E3 ubiquitin-protein ligase RNF181 [Brachypodium distachyon]|uniref:RING-type domain-containing protein n=1 Tax=Brachypodium distachyon TaxID=15368 RepID=I1IUY3_BRADI|nr:E3 ubiquitin-protein ligase RNF181 [Brachypodium distachyon]KQJ92517.1 hypothetical protein BRADI_4g44205v3 [Brachypodium distachyon]|eukprot:XP_010238795.1 E3 ubiquitin-protein ligase RNF181 [Brachypodium distachyon]